MALSAAGARLCSSSEPFEFPSPLAALFEDLQNTAPKGLLEALQPIFEAGYFGNLRRVAEKLLETADSDLISGALRGNPLSKDEVAAMRLYTLEEPRFYAALNANCNHVERSRTMLFCDYLWLLLHALRKLPPCRGTVFRRVKLDLAANYPEGHHVTWHGLSRCTQDPRVMDECKFSGTRGNCTFFTIFLSRELQARDISAYSFMPEGEVLLPPGCCFVVKGRATSGGGVAMVFLDQVPSPGLILDLAPTTEESDPPAGAPATAESATQTQAPSTAPSETQTSAPATVESETQTSAPTTVESEAQAGTPTTVESETQRGRPSTLVLETQTKATFTAGALPETPETILAPEPLNFDARCACAWHNLGVKGGGRVGGRPYNKKECFVKALELNPRRSKSWNNLGAEGGGDVGGVCFSKQECFVQALNCDVTNVNAWHNLGKYGGGIVKDMVYGQQQCFIRGLELDSTHAAIWYSLGMVGGGDVSGRTYDKKECLIRSLGHNATYSRAWSALGLQGGGTVSNRSYDKKECFVKALACDSNNHKAWHHLGNEGGGTVNNREYGQTECYGRALELDESDSMCWIHLGHAGGGVVGDRRCSDSECYIKALEGDPNCADAWAGLWSLGGGKVGHRTYNMEACYAKAEELDPWWNVDSEADQGMEEHRAARPAKRRRHCVGEQWPARLQLL